MVQNNQDLAMIKTLFREAQELKQNGKQEQAIEKYEAVLQLDPNHIPSLNKMAGIYENKKKFDQAISYLQRILQLRPNAVLTKVKLGRMMRLQGKTQESISVYQEVVNAQSELPTQVYTEIADAFIKANEVDKAIATYEKAIQLYPNNLSFYEQLLKIGQEDKVYKLFQQILQENPNHIILKKFYLKRKNIPKKYLKKALVIIENNDIKTSDSIDLLLDMSILARMLNEADKRESYIKKILELDSTNTQALVEMGDILESKEDWTQAIYYYNKSNSKDVKPKILRCIYEREKASENELELEMNSLLNNSKALKFIKDRVLSKLDIDYDDSLILHNTHTNVGDTCKYFALIKPLCIQHNKKAIVFYPNAYLSVAQANLFLNPIMPRYVAHHFPIDTETNQEILNLSSLDELGLDKIPVMPGVPRIFAQNPQWENLTYITGESTYQWGKAVALGIKIALNIDTIGQPMIEKKSLDSAEKKFKELNLPQGKSILIAPHSVTVNKKTGSNSLLISFWQKLINALVENNIVPVINARNRDIKLDSTLGYLINDENKSVNIVDLAIDEVIPFVELCGAFAGVRTGFCDFLAFSSQEVTKLCVQPRLRGNNYFGKLSGKAVIDDNLVNDNYNLYFICVKKLPDDEQISQIVNLFLKKKCSKL